MGVITQTELEEASVDCQTIEDVVNGGKNFGPSNNGTLTSRLGTGLRTIASIIDAIAANNGFDVPVDHASGIVVTNYSKTVFHNNLVYAPRYGVIPFTTTGTFDASKWRPLFNSIVPCKILYVAPNGNDTQANADKFQLGTGEWVYPTAYATIIGATNGSVVGDRIIITGSQYTESGALKGGRTYEFGFNCVLLNCVFTFDGATAGGPLYISGKPTFRRTSSASASLTLTDAEYILDLDDIDDQNAAATTSIFSFFRSWGVGRFIRMTGVSYPILVCDAQWNATAVARECYWYGEEMSSSNVTFVSTTVGVLVNVQRGQKVTFEIKNVISTNNRVFGIGALSDPPSLMETRLRLTAGRITTPQEAFLFYGRAGTNDLYHLQIGGGSIVKCGTTFISARLNTAGNMTYSVAGTALASSAPHAEVTGPTYGTLTTSGSL